MTTVCPFPNPSTRPSVASATPVFAVYQLKTLPAIGVSVASSASAVRFTLCPIPRTVPLLGVMTTLATATLDTVMVAEALMVSLENVIVAVLSATPLTSPSGATVATLGSLVVHNASRPNNSTPTASKVRPVSCTVPLGDIVAVVGATVTEVTGSALTLITSS